MDRNFRQFIWASFVHVTNLMGLSPTIQIIIAISVLIAYNAIKELSFTHKSHK